MGRGLVCCDRIEREGEKGVGGGKMWGRWGGGRGLDGTIWGREGRGGLRGG